MFYINHRHRIFFIPGEIIVKKILFVVLLLLSLSFLSCDIDTTTQTETKNIFVQPTRIIAQTNETINMLNVDDFFSFDIEEDGSMGTFYYFNVEVERSFTFSIKSETKFTVRVEIEIRYKEVNSSIVSSRSLYDSVKLSFDVGSRNYIDSERASIDISTADIPNDATIMEVNFNYYLTIVSGEITH